MVGTRSLTTFIITAFLLIIVRQSPPGTGRPQGLTRGPGGRESPSPCLPEADPSALCTPPTVPGIDLEVEDVGTPRHYGQSAARLAGEGEPIDVAQKGAAT